MPPRPLLAALALVTLAALAACSSYRPPEDLSMFRSLSHPGAELDAAEAAKTISGFRVHEGLPPVSLDPKLIQMAQAQAALMARRDKLEHNLGKPFATRLKASGYDAVRGAENIGAGYDTLAEAFSGWRASPPHRANMLLAGATRMGIAAVYTPRSKYKVFWALEIAQPDEKKNACRDCGPYRHGGNAVVRIR
jgi:uncharacterized protein YkwD